MRLSRSLYPVSGLWRFGIYNNVLFAVWCDCQVGIYSVWYLDSYGTKLCDIHYLVCDYLGRIIQCLVIRLHNSVTFPVWCVVVRFVYPVYGIWIGKVPTCVVYTVQNVIISVVLSIA